MFLIPGGSGGETPPEPAGGDARATQKLQNESMRSARRFKVSGSRFKADRRSQTAATADSLTLPSPIRWAREPKRRVGHAAYSARRPATAKPEPKKIKVNLGYLRLFKLKKFLAMPTTNGRECTRICETNISKQKGRHERGGQSNFCQTNPCARRASSKFQV